MHLTYFFFCLKQNLFLNLLENISSNSFTYSLATVLEGFVYLENAFLFIIKSILTTLYFFLVSSKILYLLILPKILFGFIAKVIFIACLFIVVRALLPRYRFDQLMDLC
jgi:NADH:ubiquinone oxidoreductase subunit H